jgi:hypothetical protein
MLARTACSIRSGTENVVKSGRTARLRTEESYRSVIRIKDVVYRVQWHLRAKMIVVRVGRLAPYLKFTRDEQPWGGSNVTCYEWCLLSDATMQTEGLSATPQQCSTALLRKQQCTCRETFSIVNEMLQFVETDWERRSCWRSLLWSTWVVTVGEEGSRSSGIMNCSLVADYTLMYHSSVQVDR